MKGEEKKTNLSSSNAEEVVISKNLNFLWIFLEMYEDYEAQRREENELNDKEEVSVDALLVAAVNENWWLL